MRACVFAMILMYGSATAQTIVRDPFVNHNWSVDGRSPVSSYVGWRPAALQTLMAIDTGTVHVSVDLRFQSALWSMTFLTPAKRETTMAFPLGMDTTTYTRLDFDLLNNQRAVTLIAVPVNYPPAPFIDSAAIFQRGIESCLAAIGDSASMMDSLKMVLSLLRWGITTISFTDSTFWKFHERELLQTGVNAKRYFAGNYTDAQVDSIRQSGAAIYYMGTKSGTRTPIRGYGQ